MDTSKLLTLIGNLSYMIGLLLVIYSYRYNSKVMGEAALGVGLIAPAENSPEWKEKERLRKISDRLFSIGMILSCMGVVSQTIGVLIS